VPASGAVKAELAATRLENEPVRQVDGVVELEKRLGVLRNLSQEPLRGREIGADVALRDDEAENVVGPVLEGAGVLESEKEEERPDPTSLASQTQHFKRRRGRWRYRCGQLRRRT